MQKQENQEKKSEKHQSTSKEFPIKKNRPVTFVQGQVEKYRENSVAGNIILKAMSEGETDLNVLRRMAGLSKIAEVHRTIDKMSLRKDYHKALYESGISMDFIVNGLKDIIEGASSSRVKLDTYKTLMKSLGLDKYETSDDSSKGWEELIRDHSEELELLEDGVDKDYEFETPEIPEDEEERINKNKKLSEELYGQ